MNIDKSIFLISRIREKVNNFLSKELENRGITGIVPSHVDILVALKINGELTMTEISTQIHRDRSTVTTLVNKLIKLGYVGTRKNESDSRSNLVFITKNGLDLQPEFSDITEKMFQKVYQNISNEEREIFNETLEKIFNNMS
jgi:DNA-binding MarR family transcriptional regulator